MPQTWAEVPGGPVTDEWNQPLEFTLEKLRVTEIAAQRPMGRELDEYEQALLEGADGNVAWYLKVTSKGADGLIGTADDLSYAKLFTRDGFVAIDYSGDE